MAAPTRHSANCLSVGRICRLTSSKLSWPWCGPCNRVGERVARGCGSGRVLCQGRPMRVAVGHGGRGGRVGPRSGPLILSPVHHVRTFEPPGVELLVAPG